MTLRTEGYDRPSADDPCSAQAPEHVWGHADSGRISIGPDPSRQGALAAVIEEIGGELEHRRQQPVADIVAVSPGAGG